MKATEEMLLDLRDAKRVIDQLSSTLQSLHYFGESSPDGVADALRNARSWHRGWCGCPAEDTAHEWTRVQSSGAHRCVRCGAEMSAWTADQAAPHYHFFRVAGGDWKDDGKVPPCNR